MEARYLTWNFANFLTVNFMAGVMIALVVLGMRMYANRAATAGAAQ